MVTVVVVVVLRVDVDCLRFVEELLAAGLHCMVGYEAAVRNGEGALSRVG